jgi:hypothetical protein
MKESNFFFTLIFFTAYLLFSSCESKVQPKQMGKTSTSGTDPLPSWNEGATKKAIINFVDKTTKEGSPDFIPVEERIACFDNDGTLWSEQPIYFQLAFVLDRVKALASQHPEWKTKEPFKSVLNGDLKTALGGGERTIVALITATSANMSTDEFDSLVTKWITTAKHPVTHKPYKEMVYEPMLELLSYLRVNNYKTFIVSGGGADFMRPWTQSVYGIPKEDVVGSNGKVKYIVIDNKPELIRLPEINFIDDKAGKPVGIHQFIGKRPVFTAGNSDGDYEMLQYTSASPLPHFAMIIHHTDSLREWAYDRQSSIGHLEKALDDAPKYNWTIVDMKQDWNLVYSFEKYKR